MQTLAKIGNEGKSLSDQGALECGHSTPSLGAILVCEHGSLQPGNTFFRSSKKLTCVCVCTHKVPSAWGHQGPRITQFLHWGDGGDEHTAISHRNAGLISASGHVSASAVCKEQWALCFEPSLLQWLPCYPKHLGSLTPSPAQHFSPQGTSGRVSLSPTARSSHLLCEPADDVQRLFILL